MIRSLLALGLTLSLVACTSELDGKSAAAVADAPSTAAPAAPVAAPVTGVVMLKADPAASSIGFVGAKVTGDHTGSFGKIDGTGKLSGGALTGMVWTMDMATVEVDHPKLTKHLKEPDFFDVAQFPQATFEATEIKATGGQPDHEITGVLELKGIKKQITFPASVDVTEDGATVKAEFTIKRFDWNIEYKGKADDRIKDEVLIKADVKLKKG